jgi:phosphate-selective porin OprO/OprP
MTNRRSFRGAGIAVALTLAVSGVARADDASEKAQLEQRVKDLESQLAEVKSTLRGGYFTANSDLEARVAELEREAGDGSMSSMFKSGMKSEGGDGAFKYQWFGLIQNDWGWYWNDADHYGGDANPGTEFRRIRLGAQGQMYGNVKWWAEVDFAHSDVRIADMWMELANCSFGNIRVGNMKEPFGFDWQTSDKFNQFMERNYIYDISNGRNVGIMLHGNCADDMVLYQVGAFRESNDVGNDTGNAKDGEYNFTGRISGRPMKNDDGTTWLHVGASASYRDYADDVLAYSSKPNLNMAPTIAGIAAVADDGMQYGAEAAFVTGPLSFLGEYAWAFPNTAGKNADIKIWSLEGAFWLTGENTAYEKSYGGWGRTSPKKNFGDGEGMGAWQLAARYQQANYNVSDVNAWTVGVNWWLNPNTRVTLDFTHANPADATYDRAIDVFGVRFQLDF